MARYADSPTMEVSTEIDAPVAVVWALVADITTPARFSSELQTATWVPPADGPALGAWFRGRNEHAAIGTWETECLVGWYEAERVFGWHVGEPETASASWRFELEPLDGDRTRLTQWAQMGPGPSGLTPAIEAMPDKEERIVERRLGEWRANMEANLEGIKAEAEAEARAG